MKKRKDGERKMNKLAQSVVYYAENELPPGPGCNVRISELMPRAARVGRLKWKSKAHESQRREYYRDDGKSALPSLPRQLTTAVTSRKPGHVVSSRRGVVEKTGELLTGQSSSCSSSATVVRYRGSNPTASAESCQFPAVNDAALRGKARVKARDSCVRTDVGLGSVAASFISATTHHQGAMVSAAATHHQSKATHQKGAPVSAPTHDQLAAIHDQGAGISSVGVRPISVSVAGNAASCCRKRHNKQRKRGCGSGGGGGSHSYSGCSGCESHSQVSLVSHTAGITTDTDSCRKRHHRRHIKRGICHKRHHRQKRDSCNKRDICHTRGLPTVGTSRAVTGSFKTTNLTLSPDLGCAAAVRKKIVPASTTATTTGITSTTSTTITATTSSNTGARLIQPPAFSCNDNKAGGSVHMRPSSARVKRLTSASSMAPVSTSSMASVPASLRSHKPSRRYRKCRKPGCVSVARTVTVSSSVHPPAQSAGRPIGRGVSASSPVRDVIGGMTTQPSAHSHSPVRATITSTAKDLRSKVKNAAGGKDKPSSLDHTSHVAPYTSPPTPRSRHGNTKAPTRPVARALSQKSCGLKRRADTKVSSVGLRPVGAGAGGVVTGIHAHQENSLNWSSPHKQAENPGHYEDTEEVQVELRKHWTLGQSLAEDIEAVKVENHHRQQQHKSSKKISSSSGGNKKRIVRCSVASANSGGKPNSNTLGPAHRDVIKEKARLSAAAAFQGKILAASPAARETTAPPSPAPARAQQLLSRTGSPSTGSSSPGGGGGGGGGGSSHTTTPRSSKSLVEEFRARLRRGKGKKSIFPSSVPVVSYKTPDSRRQPKLRNIPQTYQQLGLAPLTRSPSSENYFPRIASVLRAGQHRQQTLGMRPKKPIKKQHKVKAGEKGKGQRAGGKAKRKDSDREVTTATTTTSITKWRRRRGRRSGHRSSGSSLFSGGKRRRKNGTEKRGSWGELSLEMSSGLGQPLPLVPARSLTSARARPLTCLRRQAVVRGQLALMFPVTASMTDMVAAF
ncbi:uncharacterized protein LOC101852418 [Aplysia californica]|uniref:Uncharacterized protein LOC101852418 n=1 Tax=Aplysia californica TaxID=6500 RepID=A0ABM0JU02_APLCA|nr:uncharacterized protein LOC101852418 [Aplysia californica]XP_005101445.1 uncharacterized protein LOC101852418 [Aplysia californica]XP_005101446.1 uncharacterized protein LOC101852418 [Aplysia californica]